MLWSLLGYGVIAAFIAGFMFYKKKYVLAVAFVFLSIALAAVAAVAIYIYPQKAGL